MRLNPGAADGGLPAALSSWHPQSDIIRGFPRRKQASTPKERSICMWDSMWA